jgi:anti-sigma factor RsiW
MRHPDSERLSAYLDGLVPEGEMREVEDHLSRCRDCRTLLDELSQIKRMARDLSELSPPRDLWPRIQEGIQNPDASSTDVIRLYPEARRASKAARRGFRLSLPQAAAAGLVLALLSGALGARLGSRSEPQTAATSVEEASWVTQVSLTSPRLESSAREVARLEEVLAQHRGELDPTTIQILERNLRVIDRAIEESLQALEGDPGNQFLESHLERAIQAKGDYLRTATLLAAPQPEGMG